MNETYKVKVECTNCEFENMHTDKIEIKKGYAIYQKSWPECGTTGLIKKEN